MSRLLLLFIFVLWMIPRDNLAPALPVAGGTAIFLGAYLALVMGVRAFNMMLARRVGHQPLGRALDRYNKFAEIARYFIPVWFMVGIFVLGWGSTVHGLVGGLDPLLPNWRLGTMGYWRFPSLFVGTLPPLLAWMGLWWAQFPADRALKEQSVLYQANEGHPIHPPPTFRAFFGLQFRVQLLLTLAPAFLIVMGRDVLALIINLLLDKPMGPDSADALMLPLALFVFVFAPELIRRLIPTEPLPPDYPLRRRLEVLCKRTNIRCRDVLLWRTQSMLGNAMVMGLFPQIRYIFLSDLLLETMRDDEIEAVFAHEMGHVAHRHLWWYGLFFIGLMLLTLGPVLMLIGQIPGVGRESELQYQIATVAQMVLFGVLFGFLSRRFEKQADVFAARTMQMNQAGTPVVISHVNPEAGAAGTSPEYAGAAGLFIHKLATATIGSGEVAALSGAPAAGGRSPGHSYVGEYGAAVVVSALQRVAQVNNIPIHAHEWLHGSIGKRIRHLQELSGHPDFTHRFDKTMRRLYWGISTMLVMLVTWLVVQQVVFHVRVI